MKLERLTSTVPARSVRESHPEPETHWRRVHEIAGSDVDHHQSLRQQLAATEEMPALAEAGCEAPQQHAHAIAEQLLRLGSRADQLIKSDAVLGHTSSLNTQA